MNHEHAYQMRQLIIILILFCMSVGFLHWTKKYNPQQSYKIMAFQKK